SGETPARHVLLVDSYEDLAALDDWLRRHFLPALGDDTLVVLAGRVPPAVRWRTDAGWRAEMVDLPLRNLSADESQAFLDAQGVAPEAHEAALGFTHGHPLALALVADHVRQRPDVPFAPGDAPDVVGALLERFVQEEPDPAHRAALEAASLVRATTEPLLAAVLGQADAHRAFVWLRSLHFVEVGRRGLAPHDLAREVLAADLHWRDPARAKTVRDAARRFYSERLLDPLPGEPLHDVLGDYAFLFRGNPIVAPILSQLQGAWRQVGSREVTALREGDRDALLAMTRRHEGDASAEILARWLHVRPEGAEVYRDASGHPKGFLYSVALHEATDADRAADPGTRAASGAVGDLRRDEQAWLFRFWMDAEAHQGISVVQSLAFASTVRAYLTTPSLAASYLATTAPDLWGTILSFAGLREAPEATYSVGEQAATVYAHDWRAEPPGAWLDALSLRTPQAAPPQPPAPRDPVVVLSRDAFDRAVHDALRDYARPHKLRDSPLLQSRLVREGLASGADAVDRAERLRALLAEAAQPLAESPREAPYFRALEAAYLNPAPTQALAAERIDVPFSTFRRHLGRGMDHVAEELWRRETAT
ncbi:MAG: ATP-binding protein, partial [Bacteroidota bacterium]